jgi:hypothetical protein
LITSAWPVDLSISDIEKKLQELETPEQMLKFILLSMQTDTRKKLGMFTKQAFIKGLIMGVKMLRS